MATKRVLQLCLVLLVALSSVGAPTRAHALYCSDTYVVRRGDWLAKIARNCGISLTALRTANNWTYYSSYIYPGQILVIPGGYDSGGPGTGPSGFCGPTGTFYVVCPGDSLGKIARYYGVQWTYLQWRNNIGNANLIYPGQLIYP